MLVEVFDVEHGACALITTPHGETIMVDCGHNASTKWYPGNLLRERGNEKLDMLVVTNYDEDHVSGLINLLDSVQIRSLLRNNSVTSGQIKELKSETGIGHGIDALCDMIDSYTGPGLAFRTPELAWSVFRNGPTDFDDENNLSLIFSPTLAGLTFTFCGDMETAGWNNLDAPELRDALNRTNVLIAPHHGRASGWWDGFMECTKHLEVVVISDDAIQYKSQETQNWYASLAGGVNFAGQRRKVLTTRSDGTLRFKHDINGWNVRGAAHARPKINRL